MKLHPLDLIGGALLATFMLPAAVLAQPAGVEKRADEVLKAMTTYLSGLKNFSVKAENSLDLYTTDGEKIQFIGPAQLTISRPDKLYADSSGDLVNQAFYYDGKSLTIYNVATKHYATVPAPATIDEMMDFARDKLDVIAPAGDLLDTRAYERLTQDAKSGRYVGVSVINGVRCHHLAYRATDVDWQLWVREGKQPLPCRYVITTKGVNAAPQYAVQMSDWKVAANAPASLFQFKPPAGAKRIDFLPLPAATASAPKR